MVVAVAHEPSRAEAESFKCYMGIRISRGLLLV